MYLSQLILNPRNRLVRQDLGDAHQMHRTVMSAFPDSEGTDSARAAFGVLYRVEIGPPNNQVAVLIQSRIEPDWTRLTAGYLNLTGASVSNPHHKSVVEAYSKLLDGQILRFRLFASPTKKVRVKPREKGEQAGNSKRVELRDQNDQTAWLERRAEQSGFQLVPDASGRSVYDLRVVPRGKLFGRRNGQSGPRVTVSTVLYEGLLQIVDDERFRQSVKEGIGPSKAYGCGLLSIAPAGR